MSRRDRIAELIRDNADELADSLSRGRGLSITISNDGLDSDVDFAHDVTRQYRAMGYRAHVSTHVNTDYGEDSLEISVGVDNRRGVLTAAELAPASLAWRTPSA